MCSFYYSPVGFRQLTLLNSPRVKISTVVLLQHPPESCPWQQQRYPKRPQSDVVNYVAGRPDGRIEPARAPLIWFNPVGLPPTAEGKYSSVNGVMQI